MIHLTEEALAAKSKDLWLAVWLCDALIHEERLEGLRQGLDLLYRLLNGFWDSIYPKLDGEDPWPRFAPLDWLGEYCNAAKGSSPTLALRFLSVSGIAAGANEQQNSSQTPSDERKRLYRAMSEDVQGSLASIAALDRFCQERFAEEPPSFAALGREVEALGATIQSLLDHELKSNPDLIAPADNSVQALPETPLLPDELAGLRPNSESVVDLELPLAGEIKTTADAVAHITAAIRFLQRAAPSSAVPYLLIRALRWGELRDVNEERLPDLLESPSSDLRRDVKRLAQRENWSALLEAAEGAMCTGCGRGWLDLQRHAITACEHLGYGTPAKALRSELKHLLSDLPQLPGCTLLDDTGAANPDTVFWLHKEGFTS